MSKIMIVEDEKPLREIYSIRLAAEGYNVVTAGDGEEALALAVQEKPDLIISDVMMPKISGFDMLDILRSQPETSQVKVIMMTALSSDDQRARGENLGADRYLVKSQVGIEDVINTVHEVLNDEGNASAAANLEVAAAIPTAPASPNISASPNIAAAPAPAPAPLPVTPAPAPAPQPAPQQIIPQNPAQLTTPAAAPAPAPAPQPVAPAPAPVAPAPAPAPQPAQPEGGERVIQPLNPDVNNTAAGETLSREMDALLGNAGDGNQAQ